MFVSTLPRDSSYAHKLGMFMIAGTYSPRSGRGVESCLPCPRGAYSSLGSPSCTVPVSCFPLNQPSTSIYSADIFGFGSTSGVTFEQATDMPVTDYVATFPGTTTQHITLRSDCSGLPSAQMSVTFWAKLAFQEQYYFMGCFGDGMGWYVGTSGTGQNLAFVLTSTTATAPSLIADPEKVIDPGTWYHVAATYDGKAMSLYTNGVLTRTQAVQAGPIAYPTGSPFTLGRYEDSSTKMYFKGRVPQLWFQLMHGLLAPQCFE